MLDRAAVVFQVVLTKCDKAGPGLARLATEIATVIARHPAAHPLVRATSAQSGIGIEAMRAGLAALAPEESMR